VRFLRWALPSILGGASIAVALWLADLLSLSSYAFAGVTDAAAADRVLAVTRMALLSLEVKLFLLHLVSGALLGLLAALAGLALSPEASRVKRVLLSIAFTLAVAACALFGMMGRYPQLFSDRWWLAGGVSASLQRIVTHGLGPLGFDIAFFALLLGALAPAGLSGVRRLSLEARGKSIAVASALVIALGALWFSLPRRALAVAEGTPPNLLILASDSLRTDRIEDEEVMPFTARRIARGSLFRYAVTPIARTYPAWVSTLTGTEPRAHGVRHMFPTLGSRRDVGPTFITELRDRGYFTFAVSDFAGDIFPGFEGGFETLDTPHLTVDTLAQSTALTGHTWSLPFLRLALVRGLVPFWRNVPSLADPEWVVDSVLDRLRQARGRPFAGLVFFSTAHFPYVAPYPDYLRGAGDYRGRYLYHVPPVQPAEAPGPEDVVQIRARYDGALASIDRATERLVERLEGDGLARSTVLVITGDHGEELYEEQGIAGHGDTVRYLRSQAVPIYIEGPGVPAGTRSDAQVRHYDLAPTVLSLLEGPDAPGDFGHGTTLFDAGAVRPVCVESEIWYWPGRPLGLAGKRLDYPGISALLELEPSTREMVLRDDMEVLVESAKERAVIVGNRLYREGLTPSGHVSEMLALDGPEPSSQDVDLRTLFEERCVQGDPNLRRLYGAVVFERPRPGP
jgi:arylsulfatase A-like enzyme